MQSSHLVQRTCINSASGAGVTEGLLGAQALEVI